MKTTGPNMKTLTHATTSLPEHRHRPTIIVAITSLMLLMMGTSFAGPELVGITDNGIGTELYLQFSEELCSSPHSPYNNGAEHAPNYSVASYSGTITATLLGNQQTVRLDLAPALSSGSHTLTIDTLPNYEIYSCWLTNALLSASMPFTISGTASGPMVYCTVPTAIGSECGGEVTVHGSGFDNGASMILDTDPPSSPVVGSTQAVDPAGTTITATFSGLIAAGPYQISIENPTALNGGIVFPGQSTVPWDIPVTPVTILSWWPVFIQDCSDLNITISGTGFCPGSTVTATHWSGSPSISGTAVTASPSTGLIRATFNFSGQPYGTYALTVQNPSSGSSDTASHALLLGESGLCGAYPIHVGNCGTKTLSVAGIICPGDQVQLMPATGPAIPGSVHLIIPNTWWASNVSVDFDLDGAASGKYTVQARRGAGPWTSLTYPKVNIHSITSCPLLIDVRGRNQVGYTRDNDFYVKVYNIGCSPAAASTLTLTIPDPPATGNFLINSLSSGGSVSAGGRTVTWNIPSLNPGDIHQVWADMNFSQVGDVFELEASSSAVGCSPVLHGVQVVKSQDPNYKEGLKYYINGDETLPYEIHFENDPDEAEVPAQDVFIYDRLNPAHFDLATFSLGDITYGNEVISPPPGLTSYSTVVPFDMDGDPATTNDQFLLAIEAKLIDDPLDSDYGRLTWGYRSFDPDTLDTLAIELGFLPPNRFPPLGEGSVKYTVELLPGLPYGTVLGSAAAIVFDTNPPIFTNPWFNEIATPVYLGIVNGSAGQIRLLWDADLYAWDLYETTELANPTSWTLLNVVPDYVTPPLNIVTQPTSEPQKFYRLQRNQ